jgi:transposase
MTGTYGHRYPTEVWERAVRLRDRPQEEHPSQRAAICSVADQLGISRETLRRWVRTTEVDDGHRPGFTSDQLDELRRLRREVAELRRANEIVKAASAFFAKQLDRIRAFTLNTDDRTIKLVTRRSPLHARILHALDLDTRGWNKAHIT